MNRESYFSKIKTGGANSSSGLSFQDSCVIYYLIKSLDENRFLSVGIETDDDFTLVYEHRKLLLQVKLEELSISLAKQHIGENKILIGSTINKSLSTFLSYLKHYRNFQASAESVESKDLVTQDFEELLLRYNLESITSIPNSWSVDILPESKIEELIKLKIVDWGLNKSLFINSDKCLRDLQLVTSKKRADRDFIAKHDVVSLLHKHSQSIDIERVTKQQSYIDLIGIKKEAVLEKVSSKINHAETLLEREEYHPALATYAELAKILESEQIYIKCASILHLLNEHDEAIVYCNKALAIAPNLHYALAIKGSSLGEKGNYGRAIDFLKSANHYKPDDAIILYNLGVSYLKIGKIEKAIENFERAVFIDPNFSSPHLNLGICLFSKGHSSAALEHIEICLILEPGLPEALSQKGEIK